MNQIVQLFPPAVQGVAAGIFESTVSVWNQVWWLVLPLISFFIFWEFWLLYIRFKFIKAIQWKLLEIRVPKNVLKTPKAMEQIFAAAHAPYSYGLKWYETYLQGKVEYWMSFDLVGRAGEVHFYLRLPEQHRNLMESAIYAQYPEAEIIEAKDDYVKQMPKVLPDKTYDLWGAELVFQNPDSYPIRTYPMFEEVVEEHRVDPVATISEVMSKLKSDEQIWIQILARPTGGGWKKKGEQLLNKLTGQAPESKSEGFLEAMFGSIGEVIGEFFESWSDSLRELFSPGASPFERKKAEAANNRSLYSRMLLLNPLEKEVVDGISRKIGKLGFDTTIRFLYIDRRDAFSRDNVAAVLGMFRQFNTQHLNLFKPDKKTMTAAVHGFFKNTRLNWRRRLIFERYRDLIFNRHQPILNIEELATVYHFPITGVAAPMLQRLESRKGSPPTALPIAE